jgi:hypothetical protein
MLVEVVALVTVAEGQKCDTNCIYLEAKDLLYSFRCQFVAVFVAVVFVAVVFVAVAFVAVCSSAFELALSVSTCPVADTRGESRGPLPWGRERGHSKVRHQKSKSR